MSDVDVGRREFLRWLSVSGAGVTAAAIAPMLLPGAANAAPAGATIYVNASLIDGTGAPARRDATIVVVGDRIVAVAHGHGVPRPAGVRMVDLRGRYVIPGLWDMHAHNIVDEAIFPPLYIANGVTGIREMRGGPAVRATRARIEGGELVGPRVVAAGPSGDLTPQQQQIADLVAAGATNAEIATRLFLSRRTVEHHLGNIYHRLGIRSRVDLARYRREEG